jgi:hypothetical protein
MRSYLTDDERRQLWRHYFEEKNTDFGRVDDKRISASTSQVFIPRGASGTALRRQDESWHAVQIYRHLPQWRCKLHGGLSTGPKSEAGKSVSRENGRKGGRPLKTEPHEVLTFSDVLLTSPDVSRDLSGSSQDP